VKDYRGFRYWLVETKQRGLKVFRIQFPDGQKTPVMERLSEAEVRLEIDRLIQASLPVASAG
jgi:hypothetical protein